MSITLHYFPPPSGRKMSIALEEIGFRHKMAFVDILQGDQSAPADAWLFWQMSGLGPMTGQLTWLLAMDRLA